MSFIPISGAREELIDLIRTLVLSEEDATLWSTVLPHQDDVVAAALLAELRSSPESIAFLTENLRDKIVLFATDTFDESAWQRILEKEQEEVTARMTREDD